MSQSVSDSWTGSYMFCLNNGMELLRLDSEDERESLYRAVKLYWLKVNDEVFIDGKTGKDGKWQLIGDGAKLKKEIYGTPECLNEQDSCLIVEKNNFNMTIRSAKCRGMKQFACQKITKQDYEIANDLGPLKVDVASRMLKEIGSFEFGFDVNRFTLEATGHKRSTYFVNRNNKARRFEEPSEYLSLNFCSVFGMKLVEIDESGELEALTRLLMRNEENIDEKFSFENFSFDFDSHFKLIKNCLVLYMDSATGKSQIRYTDCMKFYSIFICEKVESDSWTGKTSEDVWAKNAQNVAGMKLLGKPKSSE